MICRTCEGSGEKTLRASRSHWGVWDRDTAPCHCPAGDNLALQTRQLSEEQRMSGIPVAVLVERVHSSLQRAFAFSEAGDMIETRASMIQAQGWLDKLKEAIR